MTDIPSLSLLIKLINMSTSDNDGEALVALRKANKIVKEFGGWEPILRGKVTVIGDPFADLTAPPKRETAPPPAPRRPAAAPTTPQAKPFHKPRTQWSPPPQPAPQAAPKPAPKPQPTAMPGLSFTKDGNGYWNVKIDVNKARSYTSGDVVIVHSRKGDKKVKLMAYNETNQYGDMLYRFVDVKPDLNDILGI